jgi:sulfate permease
MIEYTLLIPFIVAAFLAVNMGASGTAPAFSAAYGAKVIKKNLVPLLFTIFVFAGALIAGGKVSATIGKEILSPKLLTLEVTTIVFLSVALTLWLCNFLKIPQSTSQTTVFSVAGCALFYHSLETKKLFLKIIPTWFILPVIAFFLMLIIGKYLRPVYKEKPSPTVRDYWLKLVVIIASCYVAFAIGANNVGNITGPMASMASNENIIQGLGLDFVVLANVAVFVVVPYFGIGSAFMGRKIAKTTGRKLIKINSAEAALISFITAIFLLLASVLEGIPTSLVQLNTGAIFGLAVSRYGLKKVFFDHTTRMLWIIWAIAPFIAFLLTILFLFIALWLGLV